MIALIIVTHGDFAQGLLDAAYMIVGPQEGVASLCTRCGDKPEELEAKLKSMVSSLLQNYTDVLVMTDIFGGTPTNICLPLLQSQDVEVLTGVNMPMVLKFFSQRGKVPLAELGTLLKLYAQQGVVLVSESIAE